MSSNRVSQSIKSGGKKGKLCLADAESVQKILRDNYSIWSPGLAPDLYRYYIRYQFTLPWGRRNLRYWNYVLSNEPVSSCKIYNISLQSRSKEYKVAGVGAVFTPERHRGNSYATEMLELLIDRCRDDAFDALMLYSDIGTEFYEKLGFQLLGDSEFRLSLGSSSGTEYDTAESSAAAGIRIQPLSQGDLEDMLLVYVRALSRSSYGVKRDLAYFQFKTLRETYLFRHSQLSWPQLEIAATDLGQPGGAYAIFEQGGNVLRILELIGPEVKKLMLWHELMNVARRRHITLVRGWESVVPAEIKTERIRRNWAHSMLLPLNSGLVRLADYNPCPLYELDHF